MIYTLTFNPALDYKIWIDDLRKNELNRFVKFDIVGAGKGLHVSILLNNIKQKSIVLGFVGGFVGNEIIKQLKQYVFIKNDLLFIPDNTRINVKINDKNGETELGAQGAKINTQSFKTLLLKLNNLKKNDIIVLAGSAPKGIKNIFAKTAKKIVAKKVCLIVDSSNKSLLETLKYKPFLIKPNLKELEDIFRKNINTDNDAFIYMNKLRKKGAKNVLLSLGKNGCLFLGENGEKYKALTPKGKFINSSGAGDSMLAGFIYHYFKHKNIEEAIKFSVACGSATTFSTNIASQTKIIKLFKQIIITKL